jgi:hypothetical protein
MTARDIPKLLEKHSLESIQAAAAANPPAATGPRTIFSTDPATALKDPAGTGAISSGPAKPATGGATDPRTAQRRGAYRPPVPATRTIPNAPVRTPAPPPTPEAQKAEMDKNIDDIRKLMGTPNPKGGTDPSEDQKAWGELLKLLEDERKNLDTSAGSGTAAPTPTPGPAPAPSSPQPEPPAPSEPAPSTPPSSPSEPAPPASDNPPANTDNGGN